MKKILTVFVVGLAVLFMSACGSLSSTNSPDIIYDSNAQAAKQLQVPPDLTDISNSEQFILPGSSGGPVARNTLLPQFSNIRFERAGAQSWLAFDQAPEDIWPQLLSFARQQKYQIDKTEPVAGVIVTQWQATDNDARGGLLQGLVGTNEAYSRIAFRLERDGTGARLFARSQAGSEQVASTPDAGSAQWPASSHDPEVTSTLLSQLLVFLGIEEQKARGIVNDEQARLILDDAVIVTNGSGRQMIMHRGFKPAFVAIVSAIEALNYPITSSDDGIGRIEFTDSDVPVVVELSPTHISEVRVSVTNADGQRLPDDQEQSVLKALLDNLA